LNHFNSSPLRGSYLLAVVGYSLLVIGYWLFVSQVKHPVLARLIFLETLGFAELKMSKSWAKLLLTYKVWFYIRHILTCPQLGQ